MLPKTSSRLLLRRLEAGDLVDFLAYRTDPLVALYQGWDLMSEEDAKQYLERAATANTFQPGVWFQLGFALQESNQLIGDVGICLASDANSAEIGFSINRQFQGKGYGREGILLSIEYVFAATEVRHIVAQTDARNVPANKLLERLGMQLIRTTRQEFKGEMCSEHEYSLQRPSVVDY